MFRLLIGIVAVTLAMGGGASAQSDDLKQTVRDFGIIGGVWAAECDQPASITNNFATYAISSTDSVTLKYELGDGKRSRYLIRGARRIDDDHLQLSEEDLDSNPRAKFEIVLVKNNNRIRTWSSVIDGKEAIKDGVIIGVRDSRWLQRCK